MRILHRCGSSLALTRLRPSNGRPGSCSRRSMPIATYRRHSPSTRSSQTDAGCSEPVPDPGEAALGVRGPVCEQAVVRLVPGCEAVVEAGSPAEIGIDVPLPERAIEQPCIVERRIAHARVAPIDHAGKPAV